MCRRSWLVYVFVIHIFYFFYLLPAPLFLKIFSPTLAKHNLPAVTFALLSNGANPLVEDCEGRKPIDIAVENGAQQIQILLRREGRENVLGQQVFHSNISYKKEKDWKNYLYSVVRWWWLVLCIIGKGGKIDESSREFEQISWSLFWLARKLGEDFVFYLLMLRIDHQCWWYI